MSDTPQWPFPGETPLRIARTVAHTYRAALLAADPAAARAIDARMAAFAQQWVTDPEQIHDPTDQITTSEAAALVSVSVGTVRQWACTPHPHTPGAMLLPRFDRRGREVTYLVTHVTAAAQIAQTTRLVRATPARRAPELDTDAVTV
jgi:hypothetical protein